ncbi:hypothetical protein OR1_01767 [Geobacter sp. OR-1]|uniref:hypothetical protein n=1 Tax=Geobacter sp. OR-1 TaxID=1266765 RepID=UPI0005432907|nr:hypothetical protein [Geobacter sp. OR-1]GAM09488.1 hypothetical protein OR1_01767 [Geobacter sp. OR-1]
MKIHTYHGPQAAIAVPPKSPALQCPFCHAPELRRGFCSACNMIMPSPFSHNSQKPWLAAKRKRLQPPPTEYNPAVDGLADQPSESEEDLAEYSEVLDQLAVDPGDDASLDGLPPTSQEIEDLPW